MAASPPATKQIEYNPRGGARGRRPTLYDTVAGRVTVKGLFSSVPGNRNSSTPDEVLYRRARAPLRFAETDPYTPATTGSAADPALALLPDSELVAALHAFVSDFYAGTFGDIEEGYSVDWRSLDETALIALGVLVEELVKEAGLGETGDLALTERGVEEGERELGPWEEEPVELEKNSKKPPKKPVRRKYYKKKRKKKDDGGREGAGAQEGEAGQQVVDDDKTIDQQEAIDQHETADGQDVMDEQESMTQANEVRNGDKMIVDSPS